MLNLGFPELILIVVIIALLFGSSRLGEYARSLGQTVRGFKSELNEAEDSQRRALSPAPAESPLTVFVSSRLEELQQERDVTRSVVRGLPLTHPLACEFTPPSSEPLEASYLAKVEQCDIFLLVIGATISEAVIKEFQTASARQKPCLVFLKNCPRTPDALAFVDSLPTKTAAFEDLDGLKVLVRLAIIDELIRGYREGRRRTVSAADFAILVAIEGLAKSERATSSVTDHLKRAEDAYERFAYDECIKQATAAAFDDATQHRAFLWRGDAFNCLGDFDSALIDYSRALSLAPTDPECLRSMAVIRYNMHQPEAAIEFATKAINELKASDAKTRRHRYFTYILRGEARAQLSDSREAALARKDFDTALHLIEADVMMGNDLLKLRRLRGFVLDDLHKTVEAIEDLEYYSRAKPDDSETLYRLGFCYSRLGEPAKAAEMFRRCVACGQSMFLAPAEVQLRAMARDKS